MTSREIAELTGKEHFNVLIDVRKMFKDLGLENSSAKFEGSYEVRGKSCPMFVLDKEHTLCLVSGYNVKMRMAIIQRWQALDSLGGIPSFGDTYRNEQNWSSVQNCTVLKTEQPSE
ncbi:Rha family transcriptional regulator [Aeromonas caviae]|uniref:Rha family transcriptional regulator n=1 Tax=Aeromonas caviae TaxID=648 RepID=UPI0038CFEE28